MKQSKGNKKKIIGYGRISRTDGSEGESNSIENQRKLLLKEVKQYDCDAFEFLFDDGISGTRNDRPAYLKLQEEIRSGTVQMVIAKDLSRLGRDHLEVGSFIRSCIHDYGVRVVTIADNLDSEKNLNSILLGIQNLINESYAEDISKKVRIAKRTIGESGIPIGHPPYGYVRNPSNPKFWVVDEEAASIVRRIYDMTLSGLGSAQVADVLQQEGVMTPTNYKNARKGLPLKTGVWRSSTVNNILRIQAYCGDVVNFQTRKISHFSRRQIAVAPEERKIFRDVHEAIIDRATWEKVKRQQGTVRKRKRADQTHNMFSGLLKCADCGKNLHFHCNSKNPDIQYFNCPGYNKSLKECESTHYIRVDFLKQVVLGEIRRLMKFAVKHESQFVQIVMGFSKQTVEAELKRKQEKRYKMDARDREIDMLYERLYEDNASGKVSDERYARMSANYEQEQQVLHTQMQLLESEIAQQEASALTAKHFVQIVRKYTRAKKLSERMLNELIEKIEVHRVEVQNGKRLQHLTIYFYCIGDVQFPEQIPELNVCMGTRQGVEAQYSSQRKVV